MRFRLFVFMVLILLTATVPFVATHAQFDINSPLTLVTSPSYPRPYDVVVVTPQSSDINLAASEVTITANGAVVEKGSGARSARVVLGGPGSRTVIQAVVVANGTTYTKEITLRPADVSLVLEPLTTTNPLYKGGALVAPEGGVRIVALADFRTTNGSRIPATSLVYTWRLGNRVLTEESGLGKTVLSATSPVRYRTAAVSVTVTTVDESVVGYGSVNVAPTTPSLYLYRNDPLLGLDFSHALSGTRPMSGEEETFRTVAFNFKKIPVISWTLNGTSAGTERDLTVRTTSTNAGSALIGAKAVDEGGESAQTAFTVTFSAKRGTGIFGL